MTRTSSPPRRIAALALALVLALAICPISAHAYGNHTVFMTTSGAGTATASPDSAARGELIALIATPAPGSHFAQWEVVVGDIIIADYTKNPLTFSMPDETVKIKAIFSAGTAYSISVDSGDGGSAEASVFTALPGDTVLLRATPYSGRKFSRWQVVSGGVTLTSTRSTPASFVMPANDVSIKATFSGSAGATDATDTVDPNAATYLTASVTTTLATDGRTAYRITGPQRMESTEPAILTANRAAGYAAIASGQGLSTRSYADSMLHSKILMRLYFDQALVTSDITISEAYDRSRAVEQVFSSNYVNTMAFISLAQQGGFGQTVNIAIPWAEGAATTGLCVYSYDTSTNSYSLHQSTGVTVDKNGFVHFSTAAGGNYIVSAGRLEAKQV